MNRRLFARLACAGIAAPLLMLAAYRMDGTRFGWLALPFYAPGLLIAKQFVHGSPEPGQVPLYIKVAFGLNFVFIWILLLTLFTLIENLISRKREQE